MKYSVAELTRGFGAAITRRNFCTTRQEYELQHASREVVDGRWRNWDEYWRSNCSTRVKTTAHDSNEVRTRAKVAFPTTKAKVPERLPGVSLFVGVTLAKKFVMRNRIWFKGW